MVQPGLSYRVPRGLCRWRFAATLQLSWDTLAVRLHSVFVEHLCVLALIWALEMQPSQGGERERGRVHGPGGLGCGKQLAACCRKAVIGGVTRGSGRICFLFVIVVKCT